MMSNRTPNSWDDSIHFYRPTGVENPWLIITHCDTEPHWVKDFNIAITLLSFFHKPTRAIQPRAA
jgi:hypothetical protein